jgi:gamma-glutamyl:cysteine ligase YbdK (ATP-grasp superfamily)
MSFWSEAKEFGHGRRLEIVFDVYQSSNGAQEQRRLRSVRSRL